MIGRYRKKPVVIEAVQWRASTQLSVEHWLNSHGVQYRAQRTDGILTLPTLEGDMLATPGDWIIRGVKGEFYPCKPDIFEATYEPESVAS